tara:strand:- start:5232 stop:5828 length:597 start_codon:yes stop_codon:yes gene_type:complete
MTTTINRVSAGIPTGGQFAEHNRGESTVALAPQGLQFGEYVDVERHDYLDSTFTESVNAASGFTDDDFKTLSDNYLVAAIWSTTDDSDDEGRELDENFDISNFTPESRERARADLHKFLVENREHVDKARATKGYGVDESGVEGRLAHDFWLTRNGHGSGFWDSMELDRETRDGLTAGSRAAGELTITVVSATELEFV